MKTSLQTITPAEAQKWLELNTHNRPIRQKHLNFLADEIIHNRWRTTHQGIAINKDHLIDGQHRLLAIVKAGKAVECLVTTEADSDIQDVVDAGSPRSVADQLHLNNNLQHAAVICAGCRQILLLCSNGSVPKMSIGLARIIHSEFQREIEVILPMRAQFRIAKGGWILGTLAFAYSANRNCRQFLEGFYSGEHLTSEMSAKMARDFLINRKVGMKHNYTAALKLLNAAHAFVSKTKISSLSDSRAGLEYFQEKKAKFVREMQAEVAMQLSQKRD